MTRPREAGTKDGHGLHGVRVGLRAGVPVWTFSGHARHSLRRACRAAPPPRRARPGSRPGDSVFAGRDQRLQPPRSRVPARRRSAAHAAVPPSARGWSRAATKSLLRRARTSRAPGPRPRRRPGSPKARQVSGSLFVSPRCSTVVPSSGEQPGHMLHRTDGRPCGIASAWSRTQPRSTVAGWPHWALPRAPSWPTAVARESSRVPASRRSQTASCLGVAGEVAGERRRVEVVAMGVGGQCHGGSVEAAQSALQRVPERGRHHRVVGQPVAEEGVDEDPPAVALQEHALVGEIPDGRGPQSVTRQRLG